MPATVNANFMSVVHAASSGMAMSFPDVCKTPTPAGPVPIPYPNIAQSSDTADGSSTVKVDGNPIMLKGSNFKMSSGDEAGSAMGVVSSKTKGKAQPVNASFDVKVDGDNAFRLTDPMQTNCGGSANSVNPAEVQPPVVAMPLMSEDCEKVTEKKDENAKEIAKKNCGMHPDHFSAIEKVAADFQVAFYFRQTNHLCIPWIGEKHQPKPHRVFKANTIKNSDHVKEVDAWLKEYEAAAKKKGEAAAFAKINPGANPMSTNAAYSTIGSTYLGVVGEPVVDKVTRKPLKAVGTGPQLSGRSYAGKWITGDYDLFQILHAAKGCNEVSQKSRAFSRIKKAINKGCDWDAIQHGPQAQWIPTEHEKTAHGAPDVNFPASLKTALKTNDPKMEIKIEGRNPMKVVDDKVTIISPSGALFLDKPEDTAAALKCRECDKG